MKKPLILTLSTLLALGSASTDPKVTALDRWITEQVPPLVQAAQTLVRPPFDPLIELPAIANAAVKAAQELKGIFVGTERAKIAQTVLVYAVQEACPDGIEPYLMPMLESAQVADMIEEAFQRIFGAPQAVGAQPVVDASDVEPGGIQ